MPLRPDDDLFRIWASAVCADREGRVLVSHRRDYDLWNLPGGKLDAGELPDETLRRELVEETGLEVTALRLVGVYGRADGAAALTLSYAVDVAGQPRPSDEADLHLWLPAEDWPVNAHPGHHDRIPDALAPPGPVISRRQDVPWGRDYLDQLRRFARESVEPFQRDASEAMLASLPDGGDPRIVELAGRIGSATRRYQAGEHAAAELELWQAVAASCRLPGHPLKAHCYAQLGRCAAERRHWEEADEDLRRAVRWAEGGPAPEFVGAVQRGREELERSRRAAPAAG